MAAHDWTAEMIAGEVARQTLAKKCIVLVDRCNWTGHECDVLAVTTNLRIIDVEIKISRSDLRADADKEKWWIRHGWRYGQRQPAPTPREWPPRVWKHYFVAPRAIWDDSLFAALPSPRSGVLVVETQPKDSLYVRCLRRAQPDRNAARLQPEQAMEIARLANLRMWDAYRRAEGAISDVRLMREQMRALEAA